MCPPPIVPLQTDTWKKKMTDFSDLELIALLFPKPK
jgi:hypothetical protein